MYEIRGNMHVHSCYSDGTGTHDDIASAAIIAGLDFVFVTDHNVLVDGLDGYYYSSQKKVLLLAAEEIHDPVRRPQKNHLLVFEAHKELADKSQDPQSLIDTVNSTGGLSFLAHPYDPAAPRFKEPDLSWVNWDVERFTGIEIWNGMSEFKSCLSNIASAAFYAFFPERIARGPFQQTLAIWDRLLNAGHKVVGIAGADAHAIQYNMGPIQRILFPYEFHFRAINTHVLLDEPLTNDVKHDRIVILNAIRNGSCFVGYDLPADTTGFSFTAQLDQGTLQMGQSGTIRFGATLQIHTPQKASIVVLHNGSPIHTWENATHAVLPVTRAGVYRVEAYRYFKGRVRGWIFSNPIYLSEIQEIT